jgi:hypothetical protein
MKKVVPDACKGSVSYYSFFHPYATKVLRTYVSETERKIGELANDAPLFVGETVNGRITHVNLRTLERIVKDAARKAGIEQWEAVHPHCLRKAFQSVLRAEYTDSGRMDPKTQEFLMGHILPGSQDTYFDKTKVEEIRAEYNRLAFRRSSDVTQEDLKASFRKQLLLVAGFSQDEIDSMDISGAGDQEFQKMVREKLLGAMTNNGHKQKVIPAGELKSHISQGWEYIAQLPDSEVVVKLPS